MGVKINLKSEVLSKFYLIFDIFLKYSVIFYVMVHIIFWIFYKDVENFCEGPRQAEISEKHR